MFSLKLQNGILEKLPGKDTVVECHSHGQRLGRGNRGVNLILERLVFSVLLIGPYEKRFFS